MRYEGARGGSPLLATDDEGVFKTEVAGSFRGTVGAHGIEDWRVQEQVEGVVAGQEGLVLQIESMNTPR